MRTALCVISLTALMVVCVGCDAFRHDVIATKPPIVNEAPISQMVRDLTAIPTEARTQAKALRAQPVSPETLANAADFLTSVAQAVDGAITTLQAYGKEVAALRSHDAAMVEQNAKLTATIATQAAEIKTLKNGQAEIEKAFAALKAQFDARNEWLRKYLGWGVLASLLAMAASIAIMSNPTLGFAGKYLLIGSASLGGLSLAARWFLGLPDWIGYIALGVIAVFALYEVLSRSTWFTKTPTPTV